MNTYQGSPRQCLEKIIKSSSVNFTESVDVAINLKIDPRKSEEQVRGTVILPKGIGKDIRVAVFAQEENDLSEAKRAGADIVGGEDLVEKIQEGKKLNVDWCISTPDFMSKITTISRVLGAHGLMPNPKFGTLTSEVARAVKIVKSGQIKFKTDRNGIIHCKLGNVRFSINDLLENFKAVINAVKNSHSVSSKGLCLKGVFLSSTMGKAYRVNKVDEAV